jgi:hypothetical protein
VVAEPGAGRAAQLSPIDGLSLAMTMSPRVRGGGCRRERRRPEIEEVGMTASPTVVGAWGATSITGSRRAAVRPWDEEGGAARSGYPVTRDLRATLIKLRQPSILTCSA